MVLQVLIAVVMTYVIGNFTGWVTHWMFHQKWSGKLHEAHEAHHDMYSRGQFLSDAYLSTGSNSGTVFFTLFIIPVIAVAFTILMIFGVAWWTYPIILIESAFVGIIYNRIHDAIHIKNHPYEKYKWFRRLRILHRVHHANVQTNLGIYEFSWDRIMKTFRNVTLLKSNHNDRKSY